MLRTTMRKPLGIALVAGLFASVGCQQAPAPQDAAPGHPTVATVAGVHPQWQSLRRVVEQPGSIQAYEETELFARVPGHVRLFQDSQGRLIHDIGREIRGPKYDPAGKEVVEAGEVLAELVVPELVQETNQKKALVRQAEAEVEQANKALASARAMIAVADATVTEAQALYDRWESESKRMAGLVRNGVVDAQSRDETLNQFRAAGGRLASTRATVDKARADRDRAEADHKAAKSRVDVVKAEALRSEAMLGYAQIRAPYDGVVTSRKVSNGKFVQPASGQGDWLFKVARRDPVRVVIAVPEADAELVREKAEVKLAIQELNGETLSGPVARTSWALEPGPRTLRVEIDLPNKASRLRPGMYVHAQIINQLPERWTLPTSAVVKQGDATVCFLIDGDKVVRTPVQLGRSDGQFVQVLKRQKPGASGEWEELTKNDLFAGRAAGLTDGQVVQLETTGKR
jgi:HlyD family secretion protein